MEKETIQPGVVISSGETVYPTGFEWLLAFALRGCQWAIDMLPEAIENYNREEIEKDFGAGI